MFFSPNGGYPLRMLMGLDQVWVGVAEIVLGLIFCFIGYSAARVVLALWGALVGFAAGTLVQVMVVDRMPGSFLASIPWWVYALVLALLMAWLAFAFYAVGVLISMGALGWGLGQLMSNTFHLPSWVSFSMGLVVAAGLVMVGWTLNLPKVLLVVTTALAGAGAILDGIQVVLGHRLDWFDQAGWRTDTATHAAWTAAFVVLVGAGIMVQFRQHSEGTLREAYQHV